MNIARCTGQSCGSNSRIYVHEAIAFRAHHERVLGYLDTARREGATFAHGGKRPPGKGFFVEPAVLTDLDDEMTVVREEIFGPVMSVLTWRDVDDVIRRANDTPFGLTANVWTRDLTAAHRTAAALEAGYVHVNGDGRRPTGTPFGGWKSSGLGKDNGIEELVSYTREKTVTVTL